MSGPEQDDDGKAFLARWSQRKLEAKQPEPKPDPPAAAPADPKEKDQSGDPAEEFDLSTLPKLEDITGATDVSAFLRKGVPEHLRNAALRKSWALDPAVRNYVNPALDYAYDWNTPGGVPGTSELGAGVDVARMVSQIMGDHSPGEAATTAEEADTPAPAPDPSPAGQKKMEPELPTQALRRSDEAVSGAEDGATEAGSGPKSETHDPAAPQQPVRRHGSAKPAV
jgi:Protein of unknown function (DUF3306)